MTILKSRHEELPQSSTRSELPKIEESRRLIGDALKGKTMVFAVDDFDHRIDSVALKYGVFDTVGASKESGVLTYSELFAGRDAKAEIFILRSSRSFSSRIDELKSTLRQLRERNPAAAIIICAYDGDVYRDILPLVDSGIVNALEHNPPDDFGLLRKALEILERMQK